MFTPAESFLRLSRIKGKQVVQILHNVYNILTVVEHSMGMISALYRKTTTVMHCFFISYQQYIQWIGYQ